MAPSRKGLALDSTSPTTLTLPSGTLTGRKAPLEAIATAEAPPPSSLSTSHSFAPPSTLSTTPRSTPGGGTCGPPPCASGALAEISTQAPTRRHGMSPPTTRSAAVARAAERRYASHAGGGGGGGGGGVGGGPAPSSRPHSASFSLASAMASGFA